MLTSRLKIGSLIVDNGKVGVITSIVEHGKWAEEGLFILTKSFEVQYSDHHRAVITEPSMRELVEDGTIVILAY